MVHVSPAETVPLGTDVTFFATEGDVDAGVAWALDETQGLTGTLSPTFGESTVLQPLEPGHYAITATDQGRPSGCNRSGSGSVDITGTGTIDGVDVTPSATSVLPDSLITLTATVRGSPPATFDPSVEWSVDSAGGTLTTPSFLGDTATFRSSVAGGIYHLTATSRGDRTKSSTVTIAILASTITAVHLTASATTLTPVETVTLTATVDGVGAVFDDRVTWSVSPSSLFGENFNPSGKTATFTSTSPGDFVITVASFADPSKTAQVTITVQKTILSLSVTATPSTAEVGQTVQLAASVTKSVTSANGSVIWSVSPPDAAALTPTGGNTATLVGTRPNASVTVTATSVLQPDTTNSVVVTLTPPACLTQLASLPPVQPGAHQALDGRLPIVIDPSGLPIVGSIEASGGSFAGYVRRATSSGWEILGSTPVISAPDVFRMALALDVSLRPVVAFSYFDVGPRRERVNVQRWDGSQWVNLGIPSGTSQAGPEVNLTVDALDHPVVAWKNLDGNALVAVSRWSSGTDWSSVMAVPSQEVGGFVREPDLILDPTGSALMAWDEESVAHVHKPWGGVIGGGQLTRLGTPDPTGMSPSESSPSIAADGSGMPVVAWLDYPDQPPNDVSLGIRIHRSDGTGTSWTELGSGVPAHLVTAMSPAHQLVWNQARGRLGLTTVVDDTQQGALWEWDGTSWLPFCSRLVEAAGYAQGVFATGLAVEGTGAYWVAARSTSSPDLILVQRLARAGPTVTSVRPSGGDVIPQGGSTLLDCSVANGVGPVFDYAWHGYRDDGAPGPGPFTLSSDTGTPVVARLVFPTSDFYFYCVVTDHGVPVGDAHRTTSGYVKLHESDGPVGRFSLPPGPFHHTVDDIIADASASTGMVTPVTWTLERYIGTQTPEPGIEGYLKLYSGITIVWAEFWTTDSNLLSVSIPAATIPAPGIYRLRLDVFDSAFNSHTSYQYFTVLPAP